MHKHKLFYSFYYYYYYYRCIPLHVFRSVDHLQGGNKLLQDGLRIETRVGEYIDINNKNYKIVYVCAFVGY
jgi:hypothetical protein